ncbi:hypothetical protein VF06_32120, partial [Nostoc linckia z4]
IALSASSTALNMKFKESTNGIAITGAGVRSRRSGQRRFDFSTRRERSLSGGWGRWGRQGRQGRQGE